MSDRACLGLQDVRSVPAGPDGKSTAMMQHFVSYVRGANGLAGAAP